METVLIEESSAGLLGSILLLATLLLGAARLVLARPALRWRPGPWPVPFLGHVPLLVTAKLPHAALTLLARKHGDVYQLRLPWTPVLVLNGYATIRQALVGRKTAFAGRPAFRSWGRIAGGQGVTFNTISPQWVQQKNLLACAISSFMAGPEYESVIRRETAGLAAALQERGVFVTPAIQRCVARFVLTCLFGDSPDLEKSSEEAIAAFNEFKSISEEVQMTDSLPWPLHKIAWRTTQRNAEVCARISQLVAEQVPDAAGRACLAAQCRRLQGELGVEEGLIQGGLQDVLGATLDTTVSTLAFAVRYLVLEPGLQDRLHDELAQLHPEKPLSWELIQTRLHFLRATVSEILRHASVTPLSLPHCTTADTTFHGHHFPRDTMVLANLYSANHDPKRWADPAAFSPDRFLDEDGRFDAGAAARVCSFGMGVRRCLGREFGGRFLHLSVAELVRQLHITELPEAPVEAGETFSLVLAPREFRVGVERREET